MVGGRVDLPVSVGSARIFVEPEKKREKKRTKEKSPPISTDNKNGN